MPVAAMREGHSRPKPNVRPTGIRDALPFLHGANVGVSIPAINAKESGAIEMKAYDRGA